MIDMLEMFVNKDKEQVKAREKYNAAPMQAALPEGYNFVVLSRNECDDIYSLYQSYNGPKEFLYRPEKDEIEKNMEKENIGYVGIKDDKGKLAGLMKLEKLSIPSAFFIPPQYDMGENTHFYGMSGLIVSNEHRKRGLARHLTDTSLRVLHRMGATGVYADCDYRNKASFATISKRMDFVGYVDARNGAEGEQSMYVTFYASNNEANQIESANLILDFSKAKDLDNMKNVLQQTVDNFGGDDRLNFKYGKDGQYNEIHVLKNRVRTRDNQAVMIHEKELTSPVIALIQQRNSLRGM